MEPRSRLRPLPCVVALICLLLTSSRVALAAEGRWESIGPYGGSISALAVAPGAQRTLYAGTAEGLVFRSTNAGAHWSYASGGIPGYTAITDLDVDPRDPSVAYAASCAVLIEFSMKTGGLFKTVDGGRTWTQLEDLPECEVFELALDPWNSSRLFAATAAGLLQSDDGGATWRPNPAVPYDPGFFADSRVWAVAFDPLVAGTIYVFHHEMGLLKSVDGGATWTPKGPDLLAGGWELFKIVADPRTPGTLYGHTGSGAAFSVFRSTNGGESWSSAAAGLGGRVVRDLTISPVSSALYAATDDGVFRSADGGRTWTPPAPATPVREALVVAAPRWPPATVYAGVRHDGVFKSTDGGGSWRSASRGLAGVPVRTLAIAPSDPSVFYITIPERGIRRSLDGGATWQAPSQAPEGYPLGLDVDPRNASRAYATGFDGRIWKTTDAGASWRLVSSDEMGCVSAFNLEIDPRAPRNLYAAGPRDTCPQFPDVCLGFKSTDRGESWSCMEDFPTEGILSVALAPSLPTTLYASTDSFFNPPVFKSADAGQTWDARSGGLPRTQVFSLTVSPRNPRIVYAASLAGLYKSVDGAATWTSIHRGLPAGFVGGPVISPADPSVLYAVVSTFDPAIGDSASTIFRSVNAGASWSRFPGERLPERWIDSLSIFPAQPRTLYVTTRSGIYRLALPAGER